jgi:V/A-type H+-transporting ATPase subunit I
MGFHPIAARWFEVVVPREDAEDTMEALARAGEVQFEWRGEASAAGDLQPLRQAVARYRVLAAQHSEAWPAPIFEKRCCSLPVEASTAAALRSLERWHGDAGSLFRRLEEQRRERAELDQWSAILAAPGIAAFDLGGLARAGPPLRSVCLLLQQELDLPQAGLIHRFAAGGRIAYLGLTRRSEAEELCANARRMGGDCLEPPSWLQGDIEASRRALSRRGEALDVEIRHCVHELRRSAENKGVHRAIGVLERVDWFLRNAEQIRCEGDYCWITGWTSETDPEVMNRALLNLGVSASVSLMEPPLDAGSPSITRHSPWLRAFEVFTRAIGVPGVREADPTTWVAFLVPLMFGYMCGDVGHGAVILGAGLLLRHRTDLWPLLVLAGMASIGFGFAYGHVFGFEDVLRPIWIRPLEAPFLILLVPVVVGALVLTLGMLLHLVQTCWRGEGGSEGVSDGAQVLVYWGLLLLFVDERFGWLVPIGAALCLVNRLRTHRSPSALIQGFGHLLESSFTLVLNTLSFARVGAFALAHAALEAAVFALAGATGNLAAGVAILVAGNLAVILIEGLVVSIQTTRLVLFEFFMRFFEGTGRLFNPADKPPARDN